MILATPPRAALDMLEPGPRRGLEPMILGLSPVFAACLDVALAELPRPRAGFALSLASPLYVSVHSRAARLTPGRGAVVHVAKYLGSAPSPDPSADERELEELLERLQPGAQALTLVRRYRPRMIVTEGTLLPVPLGAKARPGTSSPGLPGVFLAGDWVGDRHLLADASAASACAAAEAALAHVAEAEARAA